MPLYVVLKCASCQAFQAKQHNKTLKFTCILCGKSQTVQKIWQQSSNCRDLTKVVQDLNMARSTTPFTSPPDSKQLVSNYQHDQEEHRRIQEEKAYLQEYQGEKSKYDRFTHEATQFTLHPSRFSSCTQFKPKNAPSFAGIQQPLTLTEQIISDTTSFRYNRNNKGSHSDTRKFKIQQISPCERFKGLIDSRLSFDHSESGILSNNNYRNGVKMNNNDGIYHHGDRNRDRSYGSVTEKIKISSDVNRSEYDSLEVQNGRSSDNTYSRSPADDEPNKQCNNKNDKTHHDDYQQFGQTITPTAAPRTFMKPLFNNSANNIPPSTATSHMISTNQRPLQPPENNQDCNGFAQNTDIYKSYTLKQPQIPPCGFPLSLDDNSPATTVQPSNLLQQNSTSKWDRFK